MSLKDRKNKNKEKEKEGLNMAKNEMVVMENNNNVDYNLDTAMFAMVNRHAEEMAEKRRVADYERLKREEKERQMAAMQAKKDKVTSVMNVIKNLVFIMSVVFLVWVFMSWVNVISHNTQPGGYDLIWSWNFFKVFFAQ